MSKKPQSQGLAIVGLLINILVFPGLGSIIGGRTSIGIIQILLTLISIPLMFVVIGFPLIFAVWIWGIVTGVRMVEDSEY